ncbi:MAG: hypothetical protein ACHQ2Y_06635 [Candidatus Lutacidiplasmatales archaeon]
MAKKAKRKLEADEEVRSFTFPEFDVPKFLRHEFEQSAATALAILFALVSGVASFGVDRASLPSVLSSVLPVAIGVALLVAAPFIILKIRSQSGEYTKGDWAGIIVTQLFAWLGIWFLLLNVFPP